jgi:UDP-glucose 4-epimerase
MRSVCVTGGGGFIGRRLCETLIHQNHSVTMLGRHPEAGPWHHTLAVDITGPLPAGCLEGIDTVFHLAGKAHALSEVGQDDETYFLVNTKGTAHVLEEARRAGVRKFVLFSTVKAMHSGGTRREIEQLQRHRALTEDDVIEPDTPYGRSKLAAERLVLEGSYVSEPVVLRLNAVYGPRAKGNLQRMLRAVHRGRFPSLPRTGSRRSMVHVDDVVQAAILAAEKQEAVGQVFIVSDGVDPCVREIHEAMCRALGRRPPRGHVPLPLLHAFARVGDFIGWVRRRRFLFDSDALDKLIEPAWFGSDKLRSMLGYQPAWSLEKALPDMIRELDKDILERRA